MNISERGDETKTVETQSAHKLFVWIIILLKITNVVSFNRQVMFCYHFVFVFVSPSSSLSFSIFDFALSLIALKLKTWIEY